MDEDRAAFERVIGAAPVDVAPRLVFADWLDERGLYDEATEMRRWTHEMLVAREWLRDFANNSGITYDEVVKAAIRYRDTGQETGTGTNFEPENILAGFGYYENGKWKDSGDITEDGSTLKQFWNAIVTIFGMPIPDGREACEPFACCRWDNDDGTYEGHG